MLSTMPTGKKKRGLASMTPERRREVCAMGGRASHVAGVAHKYTPDTGRAAGAKGGAVTSADREHMARIGRAGGLASGAARAAKARERRRGGTDGTGV